MRTTRTLLAIFFVFCATNFSFATSCDNCVKQVRNSRNVQEALNRAYNCAKNLSRDCQARVTNELRQRFGVVADIFMMRR